MTLERSSSPTELNLASTAPKISDRDILEAFELRAMMERARGRGMAWPPDSRFVTERAAGQRAMDNSFQLPCGLQTGKILPHLKDDAIQRMLADDPDSTWSKLRDMEAQKDHRGERVPVQTGLPAGEVPGVGVQMSAGAAAADVSGNTTDQKNVSLTKEEKLMVMMADLMACQ